MAAVEAARPAQLKLLEQLVNIDSGTGDVEGSAKIAALLNAAFGICLGCQIFAGLMRLGVIPDTVCEECANIWTRIPDPSKEPVSA